jgi:NRPS condensation-like uncharacterized protein
MLIHTILSLQGNVDKVRLNQALASAQQVYAVMRTILRSRHLKLSREIQEDLGKGVLSVAHQAQSQCTDLESHISSWMNQPFDITGGFPVRVLLLHRNDGKASLVFTFHHSAVDGLRALLFVRKVIESYNSGFSQEGAVGGSSPQIRDDIRIDRRQDELLEFAHSQRSKVQHYYWKMISSLFHRFVIAAVPPPTRVFHDRSGQSRELHFCFKTVSPKELEQIQYEVRSAGVELNDIFLAACYIAVEKWNSMHGKPCRNIRIMAPANISPKGFRYVVSNQASWFSLPTTARDRADPAKLLRKVRADMVAATMERTAFSLVYFFYLCSRFPLPLMRGIARFLMITRTYVDSILITNVGFIWPKPGSEQSAMSNIGNARILNVTGSAPVVTPMGLSLAAGIYNRHLNFCLTYRPALFAEEKAKQFLDLYVEEIKHYSNRQDI